MKTRIINGKLIDQLTQAAKALSEGGLVAFPTETVYGLGANALESDSIKKIFKAKGRPSDNPLIVHISDIDQVHHLTKHVPDYAKQLMKAFWPGPLTLILEKSQNVPTEVTSGLNTVGIRMPSHPIALKLIELSGIPIAAPSANVSGRPSSTTFEDVKEDLFGKVDFIVDGGTTNIGLESTVLDATVFPPVILRPGGVTPQQIRQIIGQVELHSSLHGAGDIENSNEVPRSPGMKYTHYSPKAQLHLVKGKPYLAALKIKELASLFSKDKMGIMATEETMPFYFEPNLNVKLMGKRQQPETIASEIFALLRELDRENVDLILAEGVPTTDLGLAIMNRLEKAANQIDTVSTKEPLKLLFICTGNTCRSSMAKVIMDKLIKENGLNVLTESAGLAAREGDAASKNAILAVKQLWSLDLTHHKAKQLSFDLLQQADLVLTMEVHHASFIHQNLPEYAHKVTTLPRFTGDLHIPGISDPYGGSLKEYLACARQIKEFLQKLVGIFGDSGLKTC